MHLPTSRKPILFTIKCLAASLFILALNSCHVGRYFYWNLAGIEDQGRFKSVGIEASQHPMPLYQGTPFQPKAIDNLYQGRYPDFNHLLKETSTIAFIIIRHDSLIHEKYLGGYDSLSVLSSFSVAKSFISALIGIALEEGKIHNIQDPVSNYLREGYHPSLQKLRVIDLLNMQAGLNFREAYTTPFSPMAKYYYGRQLDRYVRKLEVINQPGTAYDYQSAATQLLGLVLEQATGQSVMEYLEDKIWKPAGMAHPASWSIDKRDGRGKFFCCLNTTPRDLARFGILYTRKPGKEAEIIPPSWIESTRKPIEGMVDGQGYPYAYQWRITPEGGLFAKGILGQYIYVHPEKEVVIVRLGKKSANLDWGVLFAHIASQL